MALGRATNPEPEPLGLVWLKCDPYRVLAVRLGTALKPYARVHLGPNPPPGAPPSFVVLYPKGEEEELASELGRLREQVPEASIVVVSGPRPDPWLCRSALNAGASGCFHIGLEPERIVRALHCVSEGEIVISREALGALLEGAGPRADLSALTRRQVEILELVAKGRTNAEIAKQLFLAEATVKHHLYKAYKALGVENRNQAARLVRKSNPGGTPGERRTNG